MIESPRKSKGQARIECRRDLYGGWLSQWNLRRAGFCAPLYMRAATYETRRPKATTPDQLASQLHLIRTRTHGTMRSSPFTSALSAKARPKASRCSTWAETRGTLAKSKCKPTIGRLKGLSSTLLQGPERQARRLGSGLSPSVRFARKQYHGARSTSRRQGLQGPDRELIGLYTVQELRWLQHNHALSSLSSQQAAGH